jgi:hypothetical protein
VGSHREYRHAAAARLFSPADLRSCFETVHRGHLHVHEFRLERRLCHSFDPSRPLATIATEWPFQRAARDGLVDEVIFCHEQPQALASMVGSGLI